jgi:hypothetical protein
VSACRYCPKIKYDFIWGKELTSASEECSVPLTITAEKTTPDIKTCGQHSTDKQKGSVLTAYKHSDSDDYDDMTMLIRNPTHEIQVNNFIHCKMRMTMILT